MAMSVNVKQSDRWGWVCKYRSVEKFSVTLDEVRAVYKFHQKPCDLNKGHANTNCKSNLACVRMLGEDKLSVPEDGNPEVIAPKKRKAEILTRDPNKSPAGLKNLGATCYVNCFLQLWYHDSALRNLVFRLSALTEREESIQTLYEGTNVTHKVKMIVELRKVFALMAGSRRSEVDPTPFLESLGVSFLDQQDASEFCQLLLFQTLEEPILSVVESVDDSFSANFENSPRNDQHLSNSVDLMSVEMSNNFLCNRFYGSLKEQRTCRLCGSTNENSSIFTHLSLNITNCKSLDDSVRKFFAPELLEGSNMVFCDECNGKREKTRKTLLEKLPKVLYVHLMRFEWQNSGRVKSKQRISIPLLYNFSKYFTKSANGVKNCQNKVNFHLTGAIFHIGSSSTCGHYMASLKTSKNGSWKDFNDSDVKSSSVISKAKTTAAEPVVKPNKKSSNKFPKLSTDCQLGVSTDLISSTITAVSSNNPVASFSSSDAYVLVYVAENYLDQYFSASSSRSKSKVSPKQSSNPISPSELSDSSSATGSCSPQSPEEALGGNGDVVHVNGSGLGSAELKCKLPQDLEEFVKGHNNDLMKEIEAKETAKKKQMRDKADSAVFLTEFASNLPCFDAYNEPHAYAPTNMLRKFLMKPSSVSEEFNQESYDEQVKCAHAKLSYKSATISNIKRISKQAGDSLTNFSGIELVTGDDICSKCVQHAVELYLLDERLKDEWKVISKYLLNSTLQANVQLLEELDSGTALPLGVTLKCNSSGQFSLGFPARNGSHLISSGSEPMEVAMNTGAASGSGMGVNGYVISRKMLREWKKLRRAGVEHQNQESFESSVPMEDDISTDNTEDDSVSSTGELVASMCKDVICEHWKIDPNPKTWALVGDDAWNLIERYFPATEKIQPFKPRSAQEVMVPWELCGQCMLAAQQESELSQSVKLKLKPFDQALKMLQKNEILCWDGKLTPGCSNSLRLYAVPSSLIEDLKGLITSLKFNSSNANLSDLSSCSTNLLTVDYSSFYCRCPAKERLIPLHVKGPVDEKERLVVEYNNCAYFFITDEQRKLLRGLNISFPENVLYFDRNSTFLEEMSLHTEEASVLGLDNGLVLNEMESVSWMINKPLCQMCWIEANEKFDKERFSYKDKAIYIVPKFRLKSVKTYGATYSSDLNHSPNGYGGRRVCLYGAMKLTVDSAFTVFDVKKLIAAKVNRFISSLELFKYDLDSQALTILKDDSATLESYKVQPLEHLLWEEREFDEKNNKPDTDVNYRESGFAGSKLLSSSSAVNSSTSPKVTSVKQENIEVKTEAMEYMQSEALLSGV